MPFSVGGEVVAAVLAFATGIGATWARMRASRERRADELYDKVMERVQEREAALERRVAELEKEVNAYQQRDQRRDTRLLTIESCVRLLVPAVQLLDPKNQALAHVALMLRSLPVDPDSSDFDDLIDRIDAAAPDYRRPE